MPPSCGPSVGPDAVVSSLTFSARINPQMASQPAHEGTPAYRPDPSPTVATSVVPVVEIRDMRMSVHK